MGLKPSSAIRRLAPGEESEVRFEMDFPFGEASLTGRINGGEGAFGLLKLDVFQETREPYSTEELREFHPQSLRDEMEREGKLVFNLSDSAGPGQAVEVPPGSKVAALVEFSGAGGKGRAVAGELRLEGRSVQSAHLGLVVGSGIAVPHVEPSKIRVAIAPGQEIEQTVVVIEIPEAANAIALIDAPFGGLSIKNVVVFRQDRTPFTDEELEQLPPEMQEAARRDGKLVSTAVQTAKAGETLRVPASGSVRITISIRQPREAQDVDGTLHIVADRWAPIAVPIEPRAQAVTVSLPSNRVEVMQGGPPAELIVDIRLAATFPIPVDVRLGSPGEPWALRTIVQSVPVSLGGAHRVHLQVAVAGDTAVGEYSTFLQLEWADGAGALSVPIQVAVVPGRVLVQVFSKSFAGFQGSEARTSARIDCDAAKRVEFSAPYLPLDVTFMAPAQKWFASGSHTVDLVFSIDSGCWDLPNQAIIIAWDAHDGAHRGEIMLRLTVLLTREERRFLKRIQTPDGVPLAGEAEFILTNSGTCRFRGYMRATGFLSFTFNVFACLRIPNSSVSIVHQMSGQVRGTDRPGDRQYDWDVAFDTGMLPFEWPLLATAEMSVARSFELDPIIPGPMEFFKKLIDILVGLAVLAPVPGGQILAVMVLFSSDLRELTRIPTEQEGSVPGLVAAAGLSFLFGPNVVIPVFPAVAAIGTIATRSRGLRPDEIEFAIDIFGRTLPFDRIKLTNLVGFGGAEFVYPSADGTIIMNMGKAFENPTESRKDRYPEPGQVFVHELVHAWQIGNNASDARFIWRGTIGKLIKEVIEGEDAYNYGPPSLDFSDFGIEGEASLVDEWFAGKTGHAPQGMFPNGRKRKDLDDPYFHYIRDNIRLGRP